MSLEIFVIVFSCFVCHCFLLHYDFIISHFQSLVYIFLWCFMGGNSVWSMQLLKIKTSRRDGTSYTGREITLSPTGKLSEFVNDISKRYTDSEKGILKSFTSITDYDGSKVDRTVYKLQSDNTLVCDEYDAFIIAIASPDAEVDPLELNAKAYLLKGTSEIDGKDRKSTRLNS